MADAGQPPSQTPPAHAAAERPRRGDELELRVDDLAHGGAGVARRDGYVVFVEGGLPGRPACAPRS